jgi:hypothetical protein
MDRCGKYLSLPVPHGQTGGISQKVTKIIRKNFVEKSQLQSELLNKIKFVDGERIYYDTDR